VSETITAELTIAAPRTAVFEALSANAALTTWFAEAAEIAPETHSFDFWGRYTPETPCREGGRHPLFNWDPERGVAFGWNVRGAATTVTVSLAEAERGTRVTLVHADVPDRQPGQYSFADFWDLSLQNLRGWVERREIGRRCDFSLHEKDAVRLSMAVGAAPAEVFAALIEPRLLDRYVASSATVEPHVGGRYDFGWEDGGPVQILELVTGERLAYAWEYSGEPATVVTWTLEASGGETHVVLVHSGFGPDRVNDDYSTGWLKFLHSLKFMLETGRDWQAPSFSSTDYEA
jgi:uncharacterized protein YndB with AHSA1/START domain